MGLRIEFGSFEETLGTIEETPDGLVFSGPAPERLRAMCQRYRLIEDECIDGPRQLSDHELLVDLLHNRRGGNWAVEVDADGNAIEPSTTPAAILPARNTPRSPDTPASTAQQ